MQGFRGGSFKKFTLNSSRMRIATLNATRMSGKPACKHTTAFPWQVSHSAGIF